LPRYLIFACLCVDARSSQISSHLCESPHHISRQPLSQLHQPLANSLDVKDLRSTWDLCLCFRPSLFSSRHSALVDSACPSSSSPTSSLAATESAFWNCPRSPVWIIKSATIGGTATCRSSSSQPTVMDMSLLASSLRITIGFLSRSGHSSKICLIV
jgi:hypothetical protein